MPRRLARPPSSLAKSGRVYTAILDLTAEADIGKAVDALIRDAGKIDILVNNAGITGGNAPLWQLKPDVWRRVIEVNLVAPYLVCRAVVPHMIGRGLWAHRQHRLDRRQGRQSERLALFGIESRPDRLDQIAGQGIGDDGRAGERHHAGGGQDRNVRPDDASSISTTCCRKSR